MGVNRERDAWDRDTLPFDAQPPPQPEPRRGRPRVLLFIVLALVAAVVLAGGAWFEALRSSLPLPFVTRKVDRSQPVLLQSIQDLSLYKAASGNFQVIVDLEKSARYVPSFLKGERTLFVAAGTVDAEVDFARIGKGAIKVSGDGRAVSITLPRPHLTKARIDTERSYVASRDRGVLDRLGSVLSDSPTSERELYLLAEDKLEEAAAQSDLVARAEQNTRAMLQSMLRSLGYTSVTVTFQGQSAPS